MHHEGQLGCSSAICRVKKPVAWALVHDVHGKHGSDAIDTSAMTQIFSAGGKNPTDGILWTVTASTRATTRTFQPKFFMFESVSRPRCFM